MERTDNRRALRQTITRGRACAERIAAMMDDQLMQLDLPQGHAITKPDLELADRAQAALDNELIELRERLEELIAAYRSTAEAA